MLLVETEFPPEPGGSALSNQTIRSGSGRCDFPAERDGPCGDEGHWAGRPQMASIVFFTQSLGRLH